MHWLPADVTNIINFSEWHRTETEARSDRYAHRKASIEADWDHYNYKSKDRDWDK